MDILRNYRVNDLSILNRTLTYWIEQAKPILGAHETARWLEDMAKALRKHHPN